MNKGCPGATIQIKKNSNRSGAKCSIISISLPTSLYNNSHCKLGRIRMRINCYLIVAVMSY